MYIVKDNFYFQDTQPDLCIFAQKSTFCGKNKSLCENLSLTKFLTIFKNISGYFVFLGYF